MQLSEPMTDRRLAIVAIYCLLLVGISPPVQGKTLKDAPAFTPDVIGGTPARVNAYPWIAALVRTVELGGEPIGCGGSLIEPLWVLTAAHCLFDPDSAVQELPSQLNVLLGTNNLLSGGQRIAIAQTIVHENYNFDDVSQKNDIALLRLATPATQILIAPLTPEQAPLAAVGRIVTVAGWGATDNLGNTLSFNSLLEVALPVVSDSECNAQSENNADTQLCAGGDANRDSCPGDSGGPLTVPFDGARAALAGIVSRGPSMAPNFCGDRGFPGIYTRVSAYRDWIVGTIESVQARSAVIASAVLPSSRSIVAGASATAFMSIVNAGQVTAQSCQPLGPRGLGDAQFSFTATDPATNTPNAGLNAPVNIAPGASRSFVF
ncbi:MAG: trypsin-like serine protease, partial [Halioglobus sp.]